MTYLLALDQGTSSSRSIVFDAQGRIVAMAQREFRQIYPQPGWVEHDPKEIWATQLATAQEALAKARLTAQRHRLDRHHQPARDHAGVEPRAPASRSTTPSSGRTAAPSPPAPRCARAGWKPTFRAQDRADRRRLLLRHQAEVDPRQRARRARRGAARRTGLRHGGQLADVAAHRRRRCTPPTSATPRAR